MILRNKIEFKINLKKHLLGELSSVVSCGCLLCPSCHLNLNVWWTIFCINVSNICITSCSQLGSKQHSFFTFLLKNYSMLILVISVLIFVFDLSNSIFIYSYQVVRLLLLSPQTKPVSLCPIPLLNKWLCACEYCAPGPATKTATAIAGPADQTTNRHYCSNIFIVLFHIEYVWF